MRKAKATVAGDTPPAADETVTELIDAALGSDSESADVDALDIGVESLDSIRPAHEEAPAINDAPADAPKRRGRKPGSPNRPVENGALPKTKRGAIEYAEQMRRERDAAREKLNAEKITADATAIERLTLALSAGGKMLGEIMASRRGAHWRLSEPESTAFGSAWAICLAPYADTLGESVPWIVALGVTYNIFAERIAADNPDPELRGLEQVATPDGSGVQ